MDFWQRSCIPLVLLSLSHKRLGARLVCDTIISTAHNFPFKGSSQRFRHQELAG